MPYEALGPGRDKVGYQEVAADDLGEQPEWTGILEWIPTDDQRVQNDSQRPEIGGPARISAATTQQYFRSHVGRVAVLAPHPIVRVASLENDGVFQ